MVAMSKLKVIRSNLGKQNCRVPVRKLYVLSERERNKPALDLEAVYINHVDTRIHSQCAHISLFIPSSMIPMRVV